MNLENDLINLECHVVINSIKIFSGNKAKNLFSTWCFKQKLDNYTDFKRMSIKEETSFGIIFGLCAQVLLYCQ